MLSTLKSYALTTLAAATGVLILVLGYKNKQIAKLHLDILENKYGTAVQAAQQASYESSKKARKAYNDYLQVREKYVNAHGNL